MAVPINYNRVGDLAEFIKVLEVVETIEQNAMNKSLLGRISNCTFLLEQMLSGFEVQLSVLLTFGSLHPIR